MDRSDGRVADLAATALFATGVAAVGLAVALVALPVPAWLGVALPAGYRLVLVGLGFAGGLAHLLAARWARDRRSLFRVVLATLVGMTLLQVSVPVDVLALALLWLGRGAFEGG